MRSGLRVGVAQRRDQPLCVTLLFEDCFHARCGRRVVEGPVVALLGVGGQVVQLPFGFGGRGHEWVGHNAPVRIPVVEALVVVVQFPQLPTSALTGRQRRQDGLDVDRGETASNGAPLMIFTWVTPRVMSSSVMK